MQERYHSTMMTPAELQLNLIIAIKELSSCIREVFLHRRETYIDLQEFTERCTAALALANAIIAEASL